MVFRAFLKLLIWLNMITFDTYCDKSWALRESNALLTKHIHTRERGVKVGCISAKPRCASSLCSGNNRAAYEMLCKSYISTNININTLNIHKVIGLANPNKVYVIRMQMPAYQTKYELQFEQIEWHTKIYAIHVRMTINLTHVSNPTQTYDLWYETCAGNLKHT